MKALKSIVAGCVTLVFLTGAHAAAHQHQHESKDHSIVATTTTIGGSFEAVNHHGQKVTEKDFQGRPFLVYFGFTSCPDVCPATLGKLAQALDQVGKQSAMAQPLFVTVDPGYDTPAVMKTYVETLHPQLIGLTGTEAQITAMLKQYKAYAAPVESDSQPVKKKHANHAKHRQPTLMNHSNIVYLMNASGDFYDVVSGTASVDEMAEKIRQLIEKNS